MVTTEPNDADGWNISIINNGKRFLKTSSFPEEGKNECLILLIPAFLPQAFANGCSEGHWGPMEEGEILEISIFFLSNLK